MNRLHGTASGLALMLVLCACQLPMAGKLNNPADIHSASYATAHGSDGGASGDTGGSGGTTDGNAAATPTGLTATAGTNQVTLSWDGVSEATSYNVYYAAGSTAGKTSTVADSSMISGTSAVVTGLTNGTKYAFVVTASNATGEGSASSGATAMPQAPATPQAPFFIYMGSNEYLADNASVWNGPTWSADPGFDGFSVGDTATLVYAFTSDTSSVMCRVNLNDATNPNLVFNVVTMKLADSVTAGVEISGSTTAIISRQFSGTAVVFEPQPWVSSGKTSSGTVTLSFTKFEVFKNLDGLYVPSTSVALSQKTLSMSLAAGPQTLTATVAPSTATNQSLTWSSNKTSVATVDSTGKVTPVAVGTAVIKAYSVDGGLQDTCTVTVTQ